MKNMTVAILENSIYYGERLTSFISRQEYSPFTVSLYLDHPVDSEQWEKADVLVMTSSLFKMYEDTINQERLMILDEDGKGNQRGSLSVYKYQSAHVIYQELLQFCVDKSGKRLIGSSQNNAAKMIGLYTPIRDEAVMTAILEMCRNIAFHRKVLYMNFEEISLFHELLEHSDKKESLSDFIYYVKGRNSNLGARLGMLCERLEFDYLLPAQLSTEIGELSEQDWIFCLESIKNETDYEMVIFDFGSVIAPKIVLASCHYWLAICEEDDWQHRLTEQFKQTTKRILEDEDAIEIDTVNLDEARKWGGQR